MANKLKRMYKWNSDFKMYVDKYAFKHQKKIKEVLEHKIVRLYAEWLMNK